MNKAETLAAAIEKNEVLRAEIFEAAAELRRLSQHEAALKEFLEKTEWVQKTHQPGEAGKHRADVLRHRLAALEAENAELRRRWCLDVCPSAYMDDGEAQDSTFHPSIDYLRDSLETILEKRRQRYQPALKETP